MKPHIYKRWGCWHVRWPGFEYGGIRLFSDAADLAARRG